MKFCIHCGKQIKPKHEQQQYPLSRAWAHLWCISLPSQHETDRLILARKEGRQ